MARSDQDCFGNFQGKGIIQDTYFTQDIALKYKKGPCLHLLCTLCTLCKPGKPSSAQDSTRHAQFTPGQPRSALKCID